MDMLRTQHIYRSIYIKIANVNSNL